MKIDQTAFNLIASSLSKHFDSMYYVDIDTGEYEEFVHSEKLEKFNIPPKGKDFFSQSVQNAEKCVHPDDLSLVLMIHDKATVQDFLSKTSYYSIICRIIIEGKVIHIRHVYILCDDKKHVLCCMEDIEAEFQAKTEQEKNLHSAERMARLDELTGIKNKNAFAEFTRDINLKIKTGDGSYKLGVVMCDLNNLKQINDTRGHSFGDEAIQRTSRMICNIFKHSPVFRIGGDEFAVLLTDSDYDQREKLLEMLRDESYENAHSRTGPTVACGMAVYNSKRDRSFDEVFKRADKDMYKNKNEIKSQTLVESFRQMDKLDKAIPPERKRMLDGLFGAMVTIADESYVYLNDMHYDYSRWSLPLVTDFALESEYMYHADHIWQNYIHPDDIKAYREAVDAVFYGKAEIKAICYRARKPDGSYVLLATRGFVLCDKDGKPEYFGGIIVKQ